VERNKRVSFLHACAFVREILRRWRRGATIEGLVVFDPCGPGRSLRGSRRGTLHGPRGGAECDQNAGATGCGKAARWKSHKPDFPTALGNPANCAGFPLSHSPDCCWLTMKPDISCAKKTGHFNLLRTAGPSAIDSHPRTWYKGRTISFSAPNPGTCGKRRIPHDSDPTVRQCFCACHSCACLAFFALSSIPNTNSAA
jgi:hypothetical protein